MLKLADALRRKFKSPRRVLAALGIDEKLLDEVRRDTLRLAQDSRSRIRLARDAEPSRLEGNQRWSYHPSEAEGRKRTEGALDNATLERVVARLKELGLSEEDIGRVKTMLAEGLAPEVPVDDELPAGNAIRTGLPGGAFATKRMTSDAVLRRVGRRYPGLDRIEVETFGARPEPPRAPAPTRQVMARVVKRFPGIEGVIG
jgi:hypothetical protein